jgi:hypothetical protein
MKRPDADIVGAFTKMSKGGPGRLFLWRSTQPSPYAEKPLARRRRPEPRATVTLAPRFEQEGASRS